MAIRERDAGCVCAQRRLMPARRNWAAPQPPASGGCTDQGAERDCTLGSDVRALGSFRRARPSGPCVPRGDSFVREPAEAGCCRVRTCHFWEFVRAFFGCDGARVRTCAAAIGLCRFGWRRCLGSVCADFRAGCAVAPLRPVGDGVTNGRSAGNDMAELT